MKVLTIIIWLIAQAFLFRLCLHLLNATNSLLNAFGLVGVFLIWYTTYKSEAGLKIKEYFKKKLTPKTNK